jgi:hypothetical protein
MENPRQRPATAVLARSRPMCAGGTRSYAATKQAVTRLTCSLSLNDNQAPSQSGLTWGRLRSPSQRRENAATG